MGQSSNELCGHDREALRNMLAQWAETPDVVHAMAFRAWDDRSLRGPNYDEREWQIARDLNDPAKLAEMLASEERRLGIEHCGLACPDWPNMHCCRIKGHSPPHADCVGGDGFECVSSVHICEYMPQARAILRAWLELQDGETEKALEALRGAEHV